MSSKKGNHHPAHPRREARSTSLHLRVLRTAEYPLLSTRGKGLGAGSDARLRPPGSHVGTNRATRSLPDLAEGSSDTFSRTDPGAWPSQVPSSEASSPLPEDHLHRTLKAQKATPTTPRPGSLFFPAAAAEKAKPHGPPPPASGPRFTVRPEPPALPSATPFPSRRFPSAEDRAPGLGGFLPRHSAGPAPPAAGPAPARRAAHSPLSAEACRVAPEVPSMTLMVPRLVTARMALSAGW